MNLGSSWTYLEVIIILCLHRPQHTPGLNIVWLPLCLSLKCKHGLREQSVTKQFPSLSKAVCVLQMQRSSKRFQTVNEVLGDVNCSHIFYPGCMSCRPCSWANSWWPMRFNPRCILVKKQAEIQGGLHGHDGSSKDGDHAPSAQCFVMHTRSVSLHSVACNDRAELEACSRLHTERQLLMVPMTDEAALALLHGESQSAWNTSRLEEADITHMSFCHQFIEITLIFVY